MERLPDIHTSLLIRTDFTDQDAWDAVLEAVRTPSEEGFLANLHVVEDPAYRDASAGQLVALAPEWALLVLADRAALASPELPLLVVRVSPRENGQLRVIPAQLWSVENNISLANMDWAEFTSAAGADGVYRGFGG
ncbi:DUF6924 domain-containing protein [Amycolatopsis saalfeldensis]|uniref:DUF6924 domain-containing protein n=1 Tax=Amycolatopsis saalfeldensis TaxID=394193 RepID=A0A1H8T1G9_9PSEU|nr:hypothetical protein [Amycolatopsis saalfeldensis]SEO84762.1 hypothetical protein SAMN04489732_102385 [Amycolatopsis saalfeldensis]